MILSKRQRYKNIAKAPPSRKVTDDGGVVVTEKLCPIPLNYKCVDPSGVVCWLPLDNGDQFRDISESVYGMRIWREKRGKGWVRYDECAVTQGALPAPKNYKFCEGGSLTQCCEHTDVLIRNRKRANDEKQAEYLAKFKNSETKMLEAMMATAEAIAGKQQSDTRPVVEKKKPF